MSRLQDLVRQILGKEPKQTGGVAQSAISNWQAQNRQKAQQATVSPAMAKTAQTGADFAVNRLLNPIKQIPSNVKTVFGKDSTPLERGVAGLSTVGALIPGLDDAAYAAYDALKAKKAGTDPRKAFTGEEYAGLGDALTPGSPGALNMLELPIMLAMGGLKSVGDSKQAAKAAKNILDQGGALKAASRLTPEFKLNKQIDLVEDAIKGGTFTKGSDAQQALKLISEKHLKPSAINAIEKKFPVGNARIDELLTELKGVAQNKSADEALRIAIPDPFKDFDDLSLKSFKQLEGKTKVDRQFLYDLTNQGGIKQAERDIIRSVVDELPEGKVNVQEFADKVKTELLPLETSRGASFPGRGRDGMMQQSDLRYESITLPDELRGNVSNYNERVYKSPIKTSAGDIHFSSARNPIDNYFAHTRIEDLADDALSVELEFSDFLSDGKNAAKDFPGDTRRVIELQSDLFQKGRLGDEAKNIGDIIDEKPYLDRIANPRDKFDLESATKQIESVRKENLTRTSGKQELSQLQPYRNTWHERLIKEEVKQAAIDGKTKLQFPTGETAMKIEGLGDTKRWYTTGSGAGASGVNLDMDIMRVGTEITEQRPGYHVGDSDKWIITDVLEDGKFKAIHKRPLEITNDSELYFKAREWGHINDDGELNWDSIIKDDPFMDKLRASNYTEQFDISGKVDTKNPIYKFYEKTIQKYLKRNYSSKTITDPQGVKWFELDISPKQGRMPIEALGVPAFFGLQQLREKEQANETMI